MEQPRRIDALMNMLVREPDDLFLNYAIGIEYLAESNFVHAESSFRKVIALDADYVAAYYQLGKLFESQQDITHAFQYYKSGLEKAKLKKDHKAISEFGEALFMLED